MSNFCWNHVTPDRCRLSVVTLFGHAIGFGLLTDVNGVYWIWDRRNLLGSLCIIEANFWFRSCIRNLGGPCLQVTTASYAEWKKVSATLRHMDFYQNLIFCIHSPPLCLPYFPVEPRRRLHFEGPLNFSSLPDAFYLAKFHVVYWWHSTVRTSFPLTSIYLWQCFAGVGWPS